MLIWSLDTRTLCSLSSAKQICSPDRRRCLVSRHACLNPRSPRVSFLLSRPYVSTTTTLTHTHVCQSIKGMLGTLGMDPEASLKRMAHSFGLGGDGSSSSSSSEAEDN